MDISTINEKIIELDKQARGLSDVEHEINITLMMKNRAEVAENMPMYREASDKLRALREKRRRLREVAAELRGLIDQRNRQCDPKHPRYVGLEAGA